MELQVFNSTEFGFVRTATVNGEVMFVGKDVADILGYQNGSRDINRHVDEEDRHKVMIFDGNQDKETIIINESGLYSLILSSKMPNAKKFKHWVTAEVLPAIRKHGMYAIDEILENPDLVIAALTQLKEERERRKQLECQTLIQRQQIAEMQPKASYYDLILQNKNTVPITQIAKDYGMSGRKFNELLHELGVQYKFRKTYCANPHGDKNDYVLDTLKDFHEEYIWDKPVKNYIQLKYNKTMEMPEYDSSDAYKKKYLEGAIKDPKVELLIIPTIEDVEFDGNFDYAVMAQSPNYTPASADFILDIFREYIEEI